MESQVMPRRRRVLHLCDVCGQIRQAGSFLATRPGAEPVWVCEDCQRKLLLRVDDTSTPGD